MPPPPSRAGTGLSPAVAKAKEFVADIFRRAAGAGGAAGPGDGGGDAEEEEEEEDSSDGSGVECCAPPAAAAVPPGPGRCRLHPAVPPGDGSAPGAPLGSSPGLPGAPPEPGYVNYTKLRYVLEPGQPHAPPEGESGTRTPPTPTLGVHTHPPGPPLTPLPTPPEFEDDKISLPFVVTDLRGRSLRPLKERAPAPVSWQGGRKWLGGTPLSSEGAGGG